MTVNQLAQIRYRKARGLKLNKRWAESLAMANHRRRRTMAYHKDCRDSGQTPEQRRIEATHICDMLADHMDEMSPKERQFVEDISSYEYCSVKQLFWLRDLKAQYVD